MIELLVRTSVQGNGQVLLNERVESGPWELYLGIIIQDG